MHEKLIAQSVFKKLQDLLEINAVDRVLNPADKILDTSSEPGPKMIPFWHIAVSKTNERPLQNKQAGIWFVLVHMSVAKRIWEGIEKATRNDELGYKSLACTLDRDFEKNFSDHDEIIIFTIYISDLSDASERDRIGVKLEALIGNRPKFFKLCKLLSNEEKSDLNLERTYSKENIHSYRQAIEKSGILALARNKQRLQRLLLHWMTEFVSQESSFDSAMHEREKKKRDAKEFRRLEKYVEKMIASLRTAEQMALELYGYSRPFETYEAGIALAKYLKVKSDEIYSTEYFRVYRYQAQRYYVIPHDIWQRDYKRIKPDGIVDNFAIQVFDENKHVTRKKGVPSLFDEIVEKIMARTLNVADELNDEISQLRFKLMKKGQPSEHIEAYFVSKFVDIVARNCATESQMELYNLVADLLNHWPAWDNKNEYYDTVRKKHEFIIGKK